MDEPYEVWNSRCIEKAKANPYLRGINWDIPEEAQRGFAVMGRYAIDKMSQEEFNRAVFP
jgi:hypothetical protein